MGYDRSEVEGRWFGDFLVNDSVEVFESQFPEFKSIGGVSNVEFKMECVDDEIIVVSYDGAVEYDGEGSAIRTHCQFQEITELKQREEELRGQRDQAEQYFETAGNIMLVLNRDGTVERINERGSDLLGYERAELIGSD